MDIEKTKQIKYLLLRCNSLKENMIRTLNDSSSDVSGRYAAFKTYAKEYNYLADEVRNFLKLYSTRIMYFDVDKMKGWADTLWPQQKEVIDSLLIFTDSLIAFLEKEIGFIDDEYTNLENFINNKLRSLMFSKPEREIEVQNAIESLLIGKGWNKGIDYDRETGKIEFSGKEYIPDFVVSKIDLCIEVKLLREGKKSRIIDEINTDITAYNKMYKRQMFIIYDLGEIRDEVEFKRDIESAHDGIKVIVVKH